MFTHIFGRISVIEPFVSVLDPIMRGFAMEVQVNVRDLLEWTARYLIRLKWVFIVEVVRKDTDAKLFL